MKKFINYNLLPEFYSFKSAKLTVNLAYTVFFIGAGGKTGIIFDLAEFYAVRSRVIITTSTKMSAYPKCVYSIREAKEIFSKQSNGLIIFGINDDYKHMRGANTEQIEELQKICDFLFIEADGAKTLSCKFPAIHEPVFTTKIDELFIITGLSVVGKKIVDECFRYELFLNKYNFYNKNINSQINHENLINSYVMANILYYAYFANSDFLNKLIPVLKENSKINFVFNQLYPFKITGKINRFWTVSTDDKLQKATAFIREMKETLNFLLRDNFLNVPSALSEAEFYISCKNFKDLLAELKNTAKLEKTNAGRSFIIKNVIDINNHRQNYRTGKVRDILNEKREKSILSRWWMCC